MTARERRMSEQIGRERKAARLALLISWAANGNLSDEQVKDPDVREIAMKLGRYGHVSDDTWARVAELVAEVNSLVGTL